MGRSGENKPQKEAFVIKMNRRSAFSLLALLVLFATLLSGCGVNKSEEAVPAEPLASISASELGEYRAVISNHASEAEKAAANDLLMKVFAKFGVMPKSVDELMPESEKEILIGDLGREETKKIKSTLKYDDYYIGIVDGKLVVVGGSEGANIAAINELSRIIGESSDDSVFFSNTMMVDYDHPYAHDDMTINGVSVSKYTILYATGRGMREQTLAGAVRKAIISVCGVELSVLPDTEGAYGSVIFVGGTADGACLRTEGDIIYATGEVEHDFFYAAQTLIERICESDDGEIKIAAEERLQYTTADLDLSKWGVSTEKMTFMSYNLQNAGNGATSDVKFQQLADMIDSKSPDFAALQEAKTSGYGTERLLEKMANKDLYTAITVTGVSSAILYKKDKFTVIESGSQQIGWAYDEYGSTYNIFMMWGHFKSKATGAEVVVQSIHIEYAPRANEVQLKQIVDFMQEKFASVPAVMLGDYNLEESALNVKRLNDAGFTSCAKTASKKVNATAPTFPSKNIILDYIFSKGMIAEYYETLTGENNPSDHRPTYAELYIA